jgi:hypothetical protein
MFEGITSDTTRQGSRSVRLVDRVDRLRRVRVDHRRRHRRAAGFVAIVKDDYVVATPKGVAIVDVTAWGWSTLIWGVVLVLAGPGLLGGAGWARWLAIIGVAVNAVGQMAFMANYPQAYPLWNVLIVALNVVVLYALTAHWRGFKNSLA